MPDNAPQTAKRRNNSRAEVLLMFGLLLMRKCATAIPLDKDNYPPYLTSNDFENAKLVDVSRPLKQLLNDQRFSTKVRPFDAFQ